MVQKRATKKLRVRNLTITPQFEEVFYCYYFVVPAVAEKKVYKQYFE